MLEPRGKYHVETVVLDEEALERDIAADLGALIDRYAKASGESYAATAARVTRIVFRRHGIA